MKKPETVRSKFVADVIEDARMQLDESILLGKPYVPPKIRRGESIEEMERRWCVYWLLMSSPRCVAKIYRPVLEMVEGFKTHKEAQAFCDRKNKELGL